MSKYEIGDKFTITIDGKTTVNGRTLYAIKGFNSLVFDDNGLDKLENYNDSDNIITFQKLCDKISKHKVKSSLVGKLVTGIKNELYDGLYRIIGINHDGSTNTVDLITEDCVTSMSFGHSNRNYSDNGCIVKNYVENTFYIAFSDDVKKHIKPMEVEYYYNESDGPIGTLKTNTAYCKLLSFNEIGYGIDGPSKYEYAPDDKEGDVYPYFNNTSRNIRIKKYKNNPVSWWLRSRYTNNSNYDGHIDMNGSTAYEGYNISRYVAPVIRLGIPNTENNIISFDELKDIIDNNKVDNTLVGKLVTGISNKIYNGMYRIIGVNHDNTTNTVDLITEDCVTSMSFGLNNNYYYDPECLTMNFVTDIFCNAYDDNVMSYLKPMVVECYHDYHMKLFSAYGKLLSFNEIGYGQYNSPFYKEGNIYPYFNNISRNIRIKKYKNNPVRWWLRSATNNLGPNTVDNVGSISRNGEPSSRVDYYSSLFMAIVIRLGK